MEKKKQTFSLWRVVNGVINGIGLFLLVFCLLVLLIDVFKIPIFLVIIIIVLGFLFRKKIFLLWKKMNKKKKQTFSPLQVIFIVVIFIVPLIMGIVNKNNYPKEVSEYEKEIKEIEECLEKARELAQEASERERLKPIQLLSRDELLEKTDVKKETTMYEYTLEKAKANKPMAKTIAWRPMSRDCYMRKASMIEPRKNPPSIFYYYGIIIEYIVGSVTSITSMFFILLVLILITLFEGHKLKNKNNTH